jgi:hypothetical protein
LNTMRHRQYKRISRAEQEMYEKDNPSKDHAYIRKQLELRNKIVKLLKKNRQVFGAARKASGFHPHYNGGNYIDYISRKVYTDKSPLWLMRREESSFSYNKIKQLHQEYIAEATLFGITIENPYEIKDDC